MKHTLDSPPYDPVYIPPAGDRLVFASNFENAVIPLQATSFWCVLCDATTCTCAQAVSSSGSREQYGVNRFCSRGVSVQVRGFRKLLFSQFKPKCRLGLFEKPVLIMCWNQTQNISRNIFNIPGISRHFNGQNAPILSNVFIRLLWEITFYWTLFYCKITFDE